MPYLTEDEKERERLRQLALLCLETRELTDEELLRVIAWGIEIGGYFNTREHFALFGAEQVMRYRRRKAELEKLSTETLQQMGDGMDRERARQLEADEGDELPDSFFEAPPIDSDEHIVREILQRRQEGSITA